jgi:hypothetical protein
VVRTGIQVHYFYWVAVCAFSSWEWGCVLFLAETGCRWFWVLRKYRFGLEKERDDGAVVIEHASSCGCGACLVARE